MSPSAPAHRLSSGVVVVSLLQRKLKYLLLRAYRNWDFPKGLVEAGEEPIDAALREVREETTLDDLSFDWGLEFMDTGPYNKGKISRYYIARSKQSEVLFRRACSRWSGGPMASSIGSPPPRHRPAARIAPSQRA
jgi:8-oxo-dGTP pyrophosphatase MutT (NUDIX family)